MTVSIVEAQSHTTTGTTRTLTFASTPSAGDVVVLAYAGVGTGTQTISSVTGMGATWTIYTVYNVSNGHTFFAVGQTPNASGNVTVTVSIGTNNAIIRAWLVSGTDGSVTTPTGATNGSSTSGAGPSVSVSPGQFVAASAIVTAGTPTVPSAASLPSSGAWVSGANNGARYARAAIPGSTDTYQLAATSTSSTTFRFGNLIIGSATTTTTGAGAVTAPAATASGAGLTTIPAAGAVTAPKATASGAGTVTVTGAGAVTAPVATASGLGTADDTSVGVGAVTAPAATGSGTGTVTVTGAGSVTAPVPTASGAGTSTVTGVGSATAPVPTASGAGTVTVDEGMIPLDVSVDLLILSQESQSPVVETDGLVLLDASVDLVVRHQLAPATPPLGVLTEWPIRRVAHLMPALSAVNPRYGVGDYTVDYADIGRFHVFVDGVDVTYLRDSPLKFDDVTNSVQVGPLSASLTVPQMRPWDEPGDGDLSMFAPDNDPRVEVLLVREDDTVDYLFEGALAQDEDTSGPGREDYSFSAEGALLQAAHELTEVPLFQEPIDPGWLIADIMNSVTHRRYMKFRRFTSGMPKVIDRGQQGQSKWQRVLDLLTRCIDDDGRQLAIVRVGPWDFQLAWKQDTTAADYTVTKGAPGVEVSLRVDQSTRRDCIYGRGVDPEGGVWGNYFFPGLDFFLPPLYPIAGFDNIIVGTTDADTTSGNGVTLVERRMRELGYRVTIDGVWTSSDNAYVDDIQRARGITVDSSLGPQTWSAIFERPADAAFDIVRLPLAGVSSVEPFLYNANGSIAGANPGDNPKKIRHAMPEVDFGNNIWKRDAAKLAQKMLLRDAVPAHVGTITLTSDPHETGTSRFDIKPGDNVQVIGHRGDVIVQVAEVSHDDVSVTLTVDSKARDALALDAILERDRDARRDPTGRTARTTDMSTLNKSEVVQYESESRAGFYPRTAINGDTGLWTVLPMFVSQVGVAKVEFTATSPKAEIVVALFEKPITANRLASFIPDPLSSKDGWFDNVEALENTHGMTEIFGTPESPGGYWPRQKSGTDAGPLTGVLKDRASTLYSSKYGGIMWVAVFTSRSTWVQGRCFPANGR